MIRVEIEGRDPIEFEDGTSQEVIQAKVKELVGATQRSFAEDSIGHRLIGGVKEAGSRIVEGVKEAGPEIVEGMKRAATKGIGPTVQEDIVPGVVEAEKRLVRR